DYKVTGVQTCALPISLAPVRGVEAGHVRAHLPQLQDERQCRLRAAVARVGARGGLTKRESAGAIRVTTLGIDPQPVRGGDHEVRSEERRVGKGWSDRR